MKKVFPFRVSGAALLQNDHAVTLKKSLCLAASDLHGLRDQVAALPGICGADDADFKRSDPNVRAYLIAGRLAFYDADRTGGGRVVLLDSGGSGAYEQDLAYWRDYVQFGRQFGRGHLFVGTLPSTPVSEVAIELDLRGGGYYLDAPDEPDAIWREAESLLAEKPCADAVLAAIRRHGLLAVYLLERGETEFDAESENPPFFPDTLKKQAEV